MAPSGRSSLLKYLMKEGNEKYVMSQSHTSMWNMKHAHLVNQLGSDCHRVYFLAAFPPHPFDWFHGVVRWELLFEEDIQVGSKLSNFPGAAMVSTPPCCWRIRCVAGEVTSSGWRAMRRGVEVQNILC